MAKKLFDQGYNVENAWTPVGEPEFLEKEEKDRIKAIKIRRKNYDSYTAVNAVCFFTDGSKPKSFSISPLSKAYEYPNGTDIDVDTFCLQEIVDENGESKIKAEGYKL